MAALIHSPYPRGGRLLPESMAVQLQHAMSMRYSAAELRLWALEDVLSGPDHLHRDLPTRLAEIRAYRAERGRRRSSRPTPTPSHSRSAASLRSEARTRQSRAASSVASRPRRSERVKQFRRVNPMSEVRPEVTVPAMDSRWWLLSQFDSAVVTTADGSGASWYKRDPKRFTDIMRRSIAVHQQLATQWEELAEQYQDAVPELTDPKAWTETWNSGER